MSAYRQIFQRRTFPVLTVLALLVLAGGYYLFYRSNREDYFRHRYLRQLAFESGRIGDSIDAYKRLFESYQNDKAGFRPADPQRVIPGLEQTEPPDGFPATGSRAVFQERVENGRLWIYAGPIVGFVYRFQPFTPFEPRTEGDFESFFVARRDGTVLLQTGNRELRIVNVNRLLGANGKELDLAQLANSSSQARVLFAGESYELFLQPCCRGIEDEAARADGANGAAAGEIAWSPNWVVGGLVSTSQFTKNCLSISFTVALLLVALFVFVILAAPILRLFYIGPEETVRVRDALAEGATAIMGVGLLTLLLLDLHSYRALAVAEDARIERLAGEISRHVGEELGTAALQLRQLDRGVENQVRDRLGRAPALCGDLILPDGIAGVPLLTPKAEFLADRLTEAGIVYSDFERFSWVDPAGDQCFKWTLGKGRDPRVNVRERRYFRDAVEGRLWELPMGGERPPFRFTLEPVVSWATGRRTVVLATPLFEELPPAQRFVSTLTIDLSSLSRPVLPYGYGFAVIDDDGNVLFHSDPARSGHENFFEELDAGQRRVRAVVYARRSSTENVSYMGRGHRIYIKPLGDLLPGWTLVVLGDKREIRGFNLDVTTTAMLLLVLYLLVFLTVAAAIRLVRRPYRGAWLWPGDERPVYQRLAGLYLAAAISFLAALRLLEGLRLLWFAFAFPWALLLVSYGLVAAPWISRRRRLRLGAALAVVLLLLVLAPGSGPASAQEIAFPAAVALALGLFALFGRGSRAAAGEGPAAAPAYLIAASLLLVNVAVLPTAGFFCLAHQAHLETRIRHRQLDFELGLERREARLTTAYASLSKAHPQLLDRRLREVKWDLYGCGVEPDPAAKAPPEDAGSAIRNASRAAGRPPASGGPAQDEIRRPPLLPGFFAQILPLYTEDFVKVRRLLEDEDPGGDQAYVWRGLRGRGVRLTRYLGLGRDPARLRSTVAPVFPWGFPLLLPLSLLLLGGSVYGVTRLVAEKLLFLHLPSPLRDRAAGAIGLCENGVLVGSWSDETARSFAAARGMALIDLGEPRSREELLGKLQEPAAQRPVICLQRFEHRLQDPEHNLWKLELLEELIYGRNKSVVILSQVVPVWYLLDRRPPPQPPAVETSQDPEKAARAAALREEQEEKAREAVRERWRKLLRRFTLSMTEPRQGEDELAGELRRLREQDGGADAEDLAARIEAECGDDGQLRSIAAEILHGRASGASWKRFAEDLRQRTEPYYQTLWTMCNENEKILLVHLAEGGLVNPRNSAAVRKLMARGLVVRSPHFRLMNAGFQRFVASGACRDEVRQLERGAEASTWNKIRAPLVAVLIGAAAFLFITQREVFDTSVAFVGAAAAALPALFRLLGAGGGGTAGAPKSAA
jgi:hypothetical protein